MRQDRLRQRADIGAIARRGCAPRPLPDRPVLLVPFGETLLERAKALIGGDAAMDLMKRALAEQDDEFAVRQLQGPRQRIEVDIAATGQIEPLVEAAEPIPGYRGS